MLPCVEYIDQDTIDKLHKWVISTDISEDNDDQPPTYDDLLSQYKTLFASEPEPADDLTNTYMTQMLSPPTKSG